MKGQGRGGGRDLRLVGPPVDEHGDALLLCSGIEDAVTQPAIENAQAVQLGPDQGTFLRVRGERAALGIVELLLDYDCGPYSVVIAFMKEGTTATAPTASAICTHWYPTVSSCYPTVV